MTMTVLNHCEPKAVFSFFEEICSIPHGSGNTQYIADYCVSFAKERGLRYIRDEANNVIVFKDGSKGYENSPALILQGHLDMVCAKTPDNTMDMTKNGLKLAVNGDWIHAIGSSLGADNGIAVAMALAVLDDDTIPHPPLEVVLTADEETGMNGAFALDASPLTGHCMINIDSDKEGVFTVGCAGGVRASGSLPISRFSHSGVLCSITINGLQGGHSGDEIHKGRGNAIRLLGRILYSLKAENLLALLSLKGGSVDNAIPSEATATILVAPEQMPIVQNILKQQEAILKAEYAEIDDGITIVFQSEELTAAEIVDNKTLNRILSVMINTPNGVQKMSRDIPDLVQTSLNFGIVNLQSDVFSAVFSIRSSIEHEKQQLRDTLSQLFEVLDGTMEFSGEYPGWAYRKDSPLRETFLASFQTLFHKEPKVIAIHAGLECGLFSQKIDNLDCISIGPNMVDIHTVKERLSISSTGRTYQLLLDVLKNSR